MKKEFVLELREGNVVKSTERLSVRDELEVMKKVAEAMKLNYQVHVWDKAAYDHREDCL